MLLQVTNRAIIDGQYADEVKPYYGYEYLYDYHDDTRGAEGFSGRGKEGFENALLGELRRLKQTGVNTPKLGIYLHGYNCSYQDSLDDLHDLHRELSKAVGYAPILVGFSWPASRAGEYLSEREQVRESVPAFVRFLCDVDDFLRRHERDCFATTCCIADGLGNYLLRKGMEYLADYLGAPSGRMLFAETVMLAPDLAAADIETGGRAASIAGFSRRVHVYYSKHDRTLKGSGAGRFGAPRLGRHGAEDYSRIPGNVVLVDASHYANAEAIEGLRDRSGKPVSVHGAHRYHPVILADIERVLSSIDRKHIQGRVYLGDTLLAGERENHFVLA